jgi:hypothetical protein
MRDSILEQGKSCRLEHEVLSSSYSVRCRMPVQAELQLLTARGHIETSAIGRDEGVLTPVLWKAGRMRASGFFVCNTKLSTRCERGT